MSVTMAAAAAAARGGLDAYTSAADQDANTALMELDVGLRSTKTGEQCEAIVRFPRLFQKYPFPILINSAFLKLAEVFRTGDNFLRLCVLRVTQQSGKHLEKILSVDDLVKKIFSVTHSNDPVARALALRTLGSIAAIIPERRNVHHSIRESLEARDGVEVAAATFAAKRFAAASRAFAADVCDEIADAVDGVATPVSSKLRLIPIFEHTHGDPRTGARVRRTCARVLRLYPALNVTLVVLRTLTRLAGASYIDVNEQIALLLAYLRGDPRAAVKLLCLRDLRHLAAVAPHVWSEADVGALVDFCVDGGAHQVAALKVVTTLAESLAMERLDARAGSALARRLLALCETACYDLDVTVAAQAVALATAVATRRRGDDDEVGNELARVVCGAVEMLVVVATAGETARGGVALRVALRSAVTLCRARESVTAGLADALARALAVAAAPHDAATVCAALAAIGGGDAGAVAAILPRVSAALAAASTGEGEHRRLVVLLTCVVFQACRDGIPADTLAVVETAVQSVNCWDQYRIARQAARYGHHGVASRIFDSLTACIAGEHLFFWITALKEFTLAESCLVVPAGATSPQRRLAGLQQAVVSYRKGLSSLKAASTPGFPLRLQAEFATLRAETLQAHVQLAQSCATLRTCPPPAIAMTLAEPLQRAGKAGSQLLESARAFHARRAPRSAQPRLPSTLTSASLTRAPLEPVLAACCSAHEAGACDSRSGDATSRGGGAPRRWPRSATRTGASRSTDSRAALAEIGGPPARHRPRDPARKGVVQHAHTAMSAASAASPSPPSTLTRAGRGARSVDTKPARRRRAAAGNELTQTAEPHNDYFSVQFLLSFATLGLHTVNIETRVVDDDGETWARDRRLRSTVKSYIDQIQQQNQQRGSGMQYQPQRSNAFP
ncbi:PREDICTED: integrator complex subunit 7-like [Priapulus caudatus]|uniref:Integrator complex subunit 7 n=1 Tax=Priapulus caudatus TaxID=37621 RepID=A0ABM1DXY2_PRICU|nr:PREDICTED: integrator complex subunit 7-like [Priapulus caudatus]